VRTTPIALAKIQIRSTNGTLPTEIKSKNIILAKLGLEVFIG